MIGCQNVVFSSSCAVHANVCMCAFQQGKGGNCIVAVVLYSTTCHDQYHVRRSTLHLCYTEHYICMQIRSVRVFYTAILVIMQQQSYRYPVLADQLHEVSL